MKPFTWPVKGPSIDHRYWVGASGKHYTYARMKAMLQASNGPANVHISEQLEHLGLTEEFNNGESPRGLPYTFWRE